MHDSPGNTPPGSTPPASPSPASSFPGSSPGSFPGSSPGNAPDSSGATTAVPLTLQGHDILFPALPYDVSDRVAHATDDAQLQKFVNTVTFTRDQARIAHCREVFGDKYDAMRQHAGEIKQHTLDYLDVYLERFVENARSAGTQVHFAADAADANRICLEIARQAECKLCVKSKSMVTEETQLVSCLEEAGIETIETDLGEFILQVDHDAPSHLVQPMIHKDRKAVGRAFERELGVAYTEDPATLAQIARQHLRHKYREADLGISGGNFLLADSGSVVICTNEGNGRLSTSMPRIHVALVGIEKLIPSRAHLPVFLKLLSRSAIGSPITIYNHIMTGPRRAEEPDGPEQMHVILLDNGRTEVLKPQTREMLRCIRCAACLNACPVYRKIGGHAYGSVYSGPIGALITPVFRGLANYKDLPYTSSLCGACYEACPVKINIPKYLVQLRSELIGGHHDKLMDRVFFKLWALSLQQGWMYRLAGALSGWFLRRLAGFAWGKNRAAACGTNEAAETPFDSSTQKDDPAYTNRRWVRRMPGPVAGWTVNRDLVTPPGKSFRTWWDEHEKEQSSGVDHR